MATVTFNSTTLFDGTNMPKPLFQETLQRLATIDHFEDVYYDARPLCLFILSRNGHKNNPAEWFYQEESGECKTEKFYTGMAETPFDETKTLFNLSMNVVNNLNNVTKEMTFLPTTSGRYLDICSRRQVGCTIWQHLGEERKEIFTSAHFNYYNGVERTVLIKCNFKVNHLHNNDPYDEDNTGESIQVKIDYFDFSGNDIRSEIKGKGFFYRRSNILSYQAMDISGMPMII